MPNTKQPEQNKTCRCLKPNYSYVHKHKEKTKIGLWKCSNCGGYKLSM